MTDRALDPRTVPASPLDRLAARSNWTGLRVLAWFIMAFLGISSKSRWRKARFSRKASSR